MISIVVCSRHPKIDVFLEKNIKETIGDVQYEIVWIDNSCNQYSIFEAYNDGVSRSKGKYICFMHEDIVYWSQDWGRQVLSEFASDENVGMLGLIGSHFLTSMSNTWVTNKRRGQVREGRGIGKDYGAKMCYMTDYNDTDRDVVAVDGLWMVIRKNLFDIISFDSLTYKGFHFYDMDICMQVLQSGYKIRIADKIDIEHKSSGNMDVQYYLNCIQFHKKWDAYLPISSSSISQEDIQYYETMKMESYFRCIVSYKEQSKMLHSFFHKVATKLYLMFWR